VVALHEAHESGGWAWSGNAKQRFSQDPANHVASRACVNQSKGGDDISEWSDADIARSSACGGGYAVIPAGRCFLAVTTVAVKSAWDLAVDQTEADALSRTLSGCGDQTPDFTAVPPTTAAPTTTVALPDECVIAGKSAAQYDAVPGIGEVLSARLVDAQPYSSRTDLEAVRGIGPARAEAIWSHYCGS
jgi:DNA uptake protein ComE-like DNA-binding protein